MPPGASVHRPATPSDVPALARLAHAYYGGDLDGWQERLARAVTGGERVLLVETGRGTAERTVVAYARSASRAPTEPDDPAPAGTWLTGLVVDPEHRRRGHARRLLALLLAEALPGGDPVWSMTNARNEASLALHARLGFVEVLRAPRMNGEDFEGGEGVLLRVGRPGSGRLRLRAAEAQGGQGRGG